MEEKLFCAFCSAPFTKEMLEVYEGSYGCETGCTTVCVEVVCENCGRTCYEKSELGFVDKDTPEEEWQEILEMIEKGTIKDLKATPPSSNPK